MKRALKRHKRTAHASATGQSKPVAPAEPAKPKAQARKTAVVTPSERAKAQAQADTRATAASRHGREQFGTINNVIW